MQDAKLITPFWIVRFTALASTWAWAIVAVGVGLNALVKSNHLKSQIKHEIPSPTVVVINDHDIFRAGTVVTTVSALIAVLCSFVALLHVRCRPSSWASRIQGALLAFFGVWMFAALVPYTHFYRTRSAVVSASIGGVALPPSTIQAVQHSLGVSSRYKDMPFLRLVAILPWFTVLFSLVTAAILFMPVPKVPSIHESATDAGLNSPLDEKEDETELA